MVIKFYLPLHSQTRELATQKLMNIVLWCNGSTTDSGPVCPGSNPGRTTEKKPVQEIESAFLLSTS